MKSWHILNYTELMTAVTVTMYTQTQIYIITESLMSVASPATEGLAA